MKPPSQPFPDHQRCKENRWRIKTGDEEFAHRVFRALELERAPGRPRPGCRAAGIRAACRPRGVHRLIGHRLQVVVLQCAGLKEFAARCPEQYAALVECPAFVNWRRIEKGSEPVLALSFYA